jgi:hypothetical protein
MASTIPHLEQQMREIGTSDEYRTLQATDPSVLSLQQRTSRISRLRAIEAGARVRATLPYEMQREVHRRPLQEGELDVTRATNAITPAYSSDPHFEFDYWRYTPFVWPTYDIRGNPFNKRNALNFVQNVLLNPNHLARFHAMNPPKQIIFEILVCWDFNTPTTPNFDADALMAMLKLLDVFNGDIDRIKPKLMFKDSRPGYDVSPTSKTEIAPQDSGPLRQMKARALNMLNIIMVEYRNLLQNPASMRNWQRYAQGGAHPMMRIHNGPILTLPDDQKYLKARDWISATATTILDRMWGYSDTNALDRRRIGFIKYEMIRTLNMPQHYYDNDRHVRFYRERMGIPWLPLDKLNLFP